MEQHPIPQNVTSFQFKLIGDVTLKQFAYLAGGIILGYMSLKFPLIPGLLRYPIAGFWVLFGVGLAFVPIEERPLDRWLAAFVKSIYAPTQFVWKKDNPLPEILQAQLTSRNQPAPAAAPETSNLVAVPQQVKPQPPARMVIPSQPVTIVAPPPKQKPSPPPPPAPPKPQPEPVNHWATGAPLPANTSTIRSAAKSQDAVTGKRVVFEEKNPAAPAVRPADPKQIERVRLGYEQITQKLNEQILSLQKELGEGTIAKERLMELQELLMHLAGEKERLSHELVDLKRKITAGENQTAVRPTAYTSVPQETQTTVKMVTAQTAVRAGIPKLTTQPNVITGIIKDSRGSLLPNLIITVKDRESVPVRALKTNKLGQFAASTPLASGTYIIEVEDPKKAFQFQRVEVTLTDQVLPPLEIYAVSERDALRQKLTREIFGGNGI